MRFQALLTGMAVAITVGAVGLRARAQEPGPKNSSQSIGKWIRELDDDNYHQREHASGQLAKAGLPAVEPLAAAAVGGSPEVTFRALEALSELAISGDRATEDAGEAALERIADGQTGSAAMRAASVLQLHYAAREQRTI